MSTTVIVIGATGYIGQAVALAYRRAGFRVYGVVRHPEKAKILLQNEVHIIVGDLKTPDALKDHLKHAAIVVDAICDADDSPNFFEKLCQFSKERSAQPLFILTSGILVHGDNAHVVDETHEASSSLLTGRTALESRVTSSKDVRGVVLRSGFVYGGAAGYMGDVAFGIKEKDELHLIGRKEKRYSWVHIEDLADAYVRVARAGHAVNGEVFNIAGPWAPTYEEFRIAGAKAAGWKGSIKHTTEVPDDLWMKICEYNTVVSSQKAFNILGWRETHLGFVAEIDIYYASWKARN